ncbi:MAG: NTP transferase domain-containing protein [Candidatus Lokiarchaeota archaeon]|nr:NTP transferase domain-containing protein [Candidatus Lokiarchaeota archaeon]
MTGTRIASIILAGGKGTRMGVVDKHKGTFEIAGTPAIVRLLDQLDEVDIKLNVLVVGAFAEQLMGVVASHSRHSPLYVFQPVQKGTGNAAKVGIRALEAAGFEGDVLIVPGDAIIEPSILRALTDAYRSSGSDMAVLVMERTHAREFGHVVQDEDGSVLGSIEYWDIMRGILTKRMAEMMEGAKRDAARTKALIASIKELLDKELVEEKRIKKVFPAIHEALTECERAGYAAGACDAARASIEGMLGRSPRGFTIKGRFFDAEALQRGTRYVNVSIYLCRARTWFDHIGRITSNNAQNEEYLTDIMQILADAGKRIVAVPLSKPEDVMAFNTPEELDRINRYVSNPDG